MNQPRCLLIAALALALIVPFSTVLGGTKKVKVKPYKAQVSYEFKNTETTPPQGLVVALSADAVVSTDEETGSAGPFRNVSGNGSSQITLTNLADPIDAVGGDNASVTLLFRSYSSKLGVRSWWWIDAKGKRLGKKQKG